MASGSFFSRLVLTISILSACACADNFDYLEIDGHQVSTTHQLPAGFTVPDRFKFLGESHFQETFEGPQFNISTAVFTTDSELLTVHAEEHTDRSGGLDYSDLTADSVAGLAVNSMIACYDLRSETEEDISNSGFLQLLKDGGYPFDRVVAIKQFFLTNGPGTAELVLSLATDVEACFDGVPEAGVVARLELSAGAAFGSLMLVK